MRFLKRLLRALPLLVLSPIIMLVSALALAITDLMWKIAPRRPHPPSPIPHPPAPASASVVIPNWNGRDLLEKYLPSVIAAMAGHPDNEIIVVDNGSADGSAD